MRPRHGLFAWIFSIGLAVSVTAAEVVDVWPDKTSRPGFGDPTYGDLDGDGDLDLFLVHHGEGVWVWRNDGGDRWTDKSSDVTRDTRDPHGVALGDFDADGDLDAFISKGAAKGAAVGLKSDYFFRNDGNFKFTDISESMGTRNTEGRGRAPLWYDWDGDGDLDLLIFNLSTPHVLLRNNRNNGGGPFTDITEQAGLAGIPQKLEIRHPVDFDGDTDMDLVMGGQDPDAFYENVDGRLVNRSSQVGLGAQKQAASLAMGDYDRDGDLDLFVSRTWNDLKGTIDWDSKRVAVSDKRPGPPTGIDIDATGSLTFVLHAGSTPAGGHIYIGQNAKRVNENKPTFDPNQADIQGDPGLDSNDTPGFYIWRSGGRWHLRWLQPDLEIHGVQTLHVFAEVTTNGTGRIQDVDRFQMPEPGLPNNRNTFYRNENGKFVDRTDAVGIPSNPLMRSHGAVFADFDADGWPDLYVVQTGWGVTGDAPDQLLLNNGDGTFRIASNVIPTGRKGIPNGNGEGAGAADVNGDARPDLFLKAGAGQPVPGSGADILYLNPVGGKRIEVRLRGINRQTGHQGARVFVHVGELVELQENWGLAGCASYGHGNGVPLIFGLGSAGKADKIRVEWPSGRTTEISDVAAGSRITIAEDGSVPMTEWIDRPPLEREIQESEVLR